MSDEKIHPIETLRDGAELVRVLERLATAMELTEHRQSRLDDLLVGGWTNDVLFSGMVLLDASLSVTKTFRAPFAAVTIDDAASSGPLLVTANDSGDGEYQSAGPGRWVVAIGLARTIAMTGTSLRIFSTGTPKAPAFVNLTVWTKFPGLQ